MRPILEHSDASGSQAGLVQLGTTVAVWIAVRALVLPLLRSCVEVVVPGDRMGDFMAMPAGIRACDEWDGIDVGAVGVVDSFRACVGEVDRPAHGVAVRC